MNERYYGLKNENIPLDVFLYWIVSEFYTLPFQHFPYHKKYKCNSKNGIKTPIQKHVMSENQEKDEVDRSMEEFPSSPEKFHGKNIGSYEKEKSKNERYKSYTKIRW